jgi:hypothetical protein
MSKKEVLLLEVLTVDELELKFPLFEPIDFIFQENGGGKARKEKVLLLFCRTCCNLLFWRKELK